MALAARLKGEDRRVVAVIGDGAMSAGMAFEALNNAGISGADLLVILNDNDMSISEPVGALDQYLAKVLSSRLYNTVRRSGKEMLSKLPPMHELARRAEEHVKGMVLPGTLFEEFGFNYIGPIDGHDVDALVKTLANIRELKGPQFLHVVTKKGLWLPEGRGRPDPLSRRDQVRSGRRHRAQGRRASPVTRRCSATGCATWRRGTSRVVGITPAMREGSGLVRFSQEYPDRYFDVGIAEQHAVTFAGGLACEGMKPVVAIYSTFLQRAYDQPIHDIALQNLPVVFAIDRAGVVGADGATHIGAFDLSYLRCLPNIDGDGARRRERVPADALHGAARSIRPSAVRYPRGSGPGVRIEAADAGAADRQGRNPPRGQAPAASHRDPGVRFDAASCARRRRRTRCDGGQHALREAARRAN